MSPRLRRGRPTLAVGLAIALAAPLAGLLAEEARGEPPSTAPVAPTDAPFVGTGAGATAPGGPTDPPPADPVALREAIERDRARLVELIRRADGPPLADDPELRALAERLPRRQAALREASASPRPDGP